MNESTLRKAIAYGKLVNGVDVCKFGKQWVVSMDAHAAGIRKSESIKRGASCKRRSLAFEEGFRVDHMVVLGIEAG